MLTRSAVASCCSSTSRRSSCSSLFLNVFVVYEDQGEGNHVYRGSEFLVLGNTQAIFLRRLLTHAACMEFGTSDTVSDRSSAEDARQFVFAHLPSGNEACTSYSRRTSRPAPTSSSRTFCGRDASGIERLIAVETDQVRDWSTPQVARRTTSS